MGFFQGFFCGKTAQKIHRKNPLPKIRTGHHKIHEKNPHPKIREKNPHPKIRTKKSAQKIRMKIPHPHVRATAPTTPMSETNSSKPVPEKIVNSVPTWRLIYDAWRRPRQFYTHHHILISRC